MAWAHLTGFEVNSATANVEINVVGTGQTITSTVTSGSPRFSIYTNFVETVKY